MIFVLALKEAFQDSFHLLYKIIWQINRALLRNHAIKELCIFPISCISDKMNYRLVFYILTLYFSGED